MFALILDSLGSTEVLFILVVALIFFGPRKLPQLARSMGKSLAEFRKASEDFKRTWEREVNMENLEKGIDSDGENSILDKATERLRAAREAAADQSRETQPQSEITPSVTPVDPSLVQQHLSQSSAAPPSPGEPHPKHEWL